MLDLDQFRNEVGRRGIIRPNRFVVRFTPPKSPTLKGLVTNLASIPSGGSSINLSLDNTKRISLRCYSTSFPGTQMMTKDDVMRYGYGPVEKTAYGALFSNIECEFILDSNGAVYDYFYQWQKLILNSDSSDGMLAPEGKSAPYEVEYKSNYGTDLEIEVFRETGTKIMSCVSIGTYPVWIGDIRMAWDQNDSFAVLPVSFTYIDHKLIKGDQAFSGLISSLFKK